MHRNIKAIALMVLLAFLIQILSFGVVGAVSTTNVVVRLVDSNGAGIAGGKVSYYNGSWSDAVLTGSDGSVALVLPGDTTAITVRMSYTGVYQNIRQNIQTSPEFVFKTIDTVVRLEDSEGKGLAGGQARYGYPSWDSLGVTDANGEIHKQLLPGKYFFRMNYELGQQEKEQNIAANPKVVFKTINTVVRLEDMEGKGLAGGQTRYGYPSWGSFGVTDANGETQKELLPGKYFFRMNYAMGQQEKEQNIAANPKVVFLSKATQAAYTLNIGAQPQGAGSVSTAPNKSTYTKGDVVKLTASPASGYVFKGWSGTNGSEVVNNTITMNGNKSITAVFELAATGKYTLGISVQPAGSGVVTASPVKSLYCEAENVTLSVSPSQGYVFKGWSGTNGNEVINNTITMNGNKSIAAVFEATQEDDGTLINETNLVYQGAFKLPRGSFGTPGIYDGFAYGGTCLAYNPNNSSLFMVGHDWKQLVAEVNIPPLVSSANLADLNTAAVLQNFTDPTEGNMQNLMNGGATYNGTVKMGGLLVSNGKLIGTSYGYYLGTGLTRSHFTSGLNLSVEGDFRGMYKVGANIGTAFVDGYMGLIPQKWQAILGGTALTGNMGLCGIARTSYGPAAFAFNPDDLGVNDPAPANPLVYYPDNYQTLGGWGQTSDIFNGSTEIKGVVFPEGSRSVLFFGRQGKGEFRYGAGTSDASLDGKQVVPGENNYYIYDPVYSTKGCHAFPYAYQVWAYDANDLAAVKNGQKQPWEITPYRTWNLNLPFDPYTRSINGASYDPETQRIFVSQGYGDGSLPVIHVFKIELTPKP